MEAILRAYYDEALSKPVYMYAAILDFRIRFSFF